MLISADIKQSLNIKKDIYVRVTTKSDCLFEFGFWAKHEGAYIASDVLPVSGTIEPGEYANVFYVTTQRKNI